MVSGIFLFFSGGSGWVGEGGGGGGLLMGVVRALLFMVAFVVDVVNIWRTRNEGGKRAAGGGALLGVFGTGVGSGVEAHRSLATFYERYYRFGVGVYQIAIIPQITKDQTIEAHLPRVTYSVPPSPPLPIRQSQQCLRRGNQLPSLQNYRTEFQTQKVTAISPHQHEKFLIENLSSVLRVGRREKARYGSSDDQNQTNMMGEENTPLTVLYPRRGGNFVIIKQRSYQQSQQTFRPLPL